MTTATSQTASGFAKRTLPVKTISFLLLLFVLCGYTTLLVLQAHWQLPLADLFKPSHELSLTQLASQMTIVPTMLVAIMAGGLLGLVSILLQQMVKNNLASDTTLAVGSGAQMALLLVTLFLPSIGILGGFSIAFIGALLSMGLVFTMALPSKLNPLVLVLCGLIVNILLVAMSNVLLIFNAEQSLNVMAWGGGNVFQTSWRATKGLALTSLIIFVLITPLLKPLALMSLDDSQAQRLGVQIHKIRAFLVVLIAIVTAMVVSEVGILSFIGLGSATLVNALQVRKLTARLLLSFVFGAILLLVTSNLATLIALVSPIVIPAGALSGILGAPLIIWLILRQKKQPIETVTPTLAVARKSTPWLTWLMVLTALFVMLQMLAPVFTQETGIYWTLSTNSELIQHYRLPRSIGAVATGVMLAVAGVLIQTLTRNPMASPEVLGISSGSALGVLLSFLILPMLGITVGMSAMIISGMVGALLVLFFLLWLGKSVSSAYLLLVGIAVSAMMNGILNIIQLTGDPRLKAMLNWLSGTSYALRPDTAWWLLSIALILLFISFLLVKPLQIISLGDTVAQNVGVNVCFYQAAIMFVIAGLSATSTLAVGPLSFIGLMVPHLAVSLGAVQLHKQLLLSALLGGLLMLVADWIGRYCIFPYEIPAGTIASIIGGLYFVYLMRRMQ